MAGDARRRRLTGKGAFDAVLRHGRRHDGTYLQMISVAAAREVGRAGFVIGRKVLPLAVDRNRIRRMLRAILDDARPSIDRLDVVVRLKHAGRRSEYASIAAEGVRLIRHVATEATEQRRTG